ncbi:MAG: GNAT family protein [Robiginitomaculum sp.]
MRKRGQAPKFLYETCASGGVELRAPSWADFESWVSLRASNQTYLQPWEPTFTQGHLKHATYKTRLSRFKKLTAEDKAYPFYIFRVDTNALVGACNLTQIQRGSSQSGHIGYWVGEGFSRQGFARAAVRAALKFAFTDLRLRRISAAVQADNEASIKLLENLGFAQEGLARDYLKIDGRWRDHVIFAKLSTD